MKDVLDKLEKKLNGYKKMLEGNLNGLDPHHNKVPDIEDAADMDNKRSRKMKTDSFRNGINVEEYDYDGEKETIKRAKGAADLSKAEEPDMASPDQPKGLENKRKPVTHDECGRPFAKEDDLDAKIKAKLKAEMDKRKFGEADATRHIIDRDRGEKIAKEPKPKPLLQTERELIKYDSNGQWSLEKEDDKPFSTSDSKTSVDSSFRSRSERSLHKMAQYKNKIDDLVKQHRSQTYEDHPTKGHSLFELEMSAPGGDKSYSNVKQIGPDNTETNHGRTQSGSTHLRRKEGEMHGLGLSHTPGVGSDFSYISPDQHADYRAKIGEWVSNPKNKEKLSQHTSMKEEATKLKNELAGMHDKNAGLADMSHGQLKKKLAKLESKYLKEGKLNKNEIEVSEWTDGTIEISCGEDVDQRVFDMLCKSIENSGYEDLEKKDWSPKAEHKSDKGGLTEAGRKSYNKATGGNLKAPQPGGGKRKKSFCARNKGQIDMHNIDCKKTPEKRACKARRRWKC